MRRGIEPLKSDVLVFGEIINSGGAGNAGYDRFLAPYLRDTDHGAYDFPLFSAVRSAFSFNGTMSTLVNPGAVGLALPNARAITFTVTHDIPNNAGFRYQILDATDEKLAYAYVMGRDGRHSAAVFGQQRRRRQPLGHRMESR